MPSLIQSLTAKCQQALEEHKRYVLTEGDIVVAMTRPTLGNQLKIAKLKSKQDKSLLNQRVAKLVVKKGNDEEFIYQLFRTDKIAYQINTALLGTDPPNLSVTVLHDFKVLVPSLPEQKKIAQILSTWDKAISITEQLLANSQQQKKALMQQLLTGKKRFSGLTGEWELVKLGNISKPQQWPTIPSSQLSSSGYSTYGANGFIGYYCEYNHENETVTVTCRGSTCGEVSLIPAKSYITGNSMCLDEIDPTKHSYVFIYYLLCFRGFKDVISGSAQPQIVGNAIKRIKIEIPSLREQQRIASVLSASDCEIDALLKKLSYLKQEKKALMQQLLIGKRRVTTN